MKILMLGGTRFFGKMILHELLDNSYEVVLVSRKPPVPEKDRLNLSHIPGERDDLSTLESIRRMGPYDVVVDNIAYQPRQIEALLPFLESPEKIKRYLLTSTCAVYLDRFTQGPCSEDMVPLNDSLQTSVFPESVVPYALGKTACEMVLKASGISYLILRLPFVTGPGDFSCRLAYFLHRIHNGCVYLPGDAKHLQQIFPLQIAAVFMEAIRNCCSMPDLAVNVASPPVNIDTFLYAVAKEMGRMYDVKRVTSNHHDVSIEDFPYVYNQVMSDDLFIKNFTTRLSPITDFMDITVKWYLDHASLWSEKYLPLSN